MRLVSQLSYKSLIYIVPALNSNICIHIKLRIHLVYDLLEQIVEMKLGMNRNMCYYVSREMMY